ncbi:MAG: anaerobic ribonucleoside-triphosphate reductase activating protein [Bacteroidales bacterium]|nr:anaerobic ribonucleoside-triphosphate reductase activating protein [Bacteroidales bacterium]
MNYHNITKDDMLNGDGLRVVLWVAGCNHNCFNCQNPETHSPISGIEFDSEAIKEIFEELDKDYIQGLTLSGGDPLYPDNRATMCKLCREIKNKYPKKDIWLYTGYKWEDIKDLEIMQFVDALVDGEFIQNLADENYKWAGSTNQRVIDVKKSLKLDKIILHE